MSELQNILNFRGLKSTENQTSKIDWIIEL